MKLLEIPKKSGGVRKIVSPSYYQKKKNRRCLKRLQLEQLKICNSDIVHGFTIDKNCVTNAEKHIGFNYTLSFDIKDFFDSVTNQMINDRLGNGDLFMNIVRSFAFHNGIAAQGIPTSPILANIAAAVIDSDIIKLFGAEKLEINKDIVYTRYADDLAFSFNDYLLVNFLKENISTIVSKHGFSINNKKTRLQDSRFGNRQITGISVGANELKISRKLRRKIRAAKHRGNFNRFIGLTECSKLKLPKNKQLNKLLERPFSDYSQSDIDFILKYFGLENMDIGYLKEITNRML